MKLADWLDKHSVSQADFARYVGRSKATISRIVNGRRQPSLQTMMRITKATDNEVMPNDFCEVQ